MAAKITRDVLESYMFCQYKSYLKLTCQYGAKSDYETLLTTFRSEVRRKAINRIIDQYQEHQVVRNTPLTTAVLKRGPLFVLEPTLEDDLISLSFDGLKRVPGPSKLGEFLYIPMLFHEGQQVRKEQRLLLELHGRLLSRYQGMEPGSGIIWHGRDCKATRRRLNPDPRKVEQVLSELEKMCSAEAQPKLILNDHCQVCEFRQRCHDQAVQEDNLSLLRGISVKEIKSYNRKGILTVSVPCRRCSTSFSGYASSSMKSTCSSR